MPAAQTVNSCILHMYADTAVNRCARTDERTLTPKQPALSEPMQYLPLPVRAKNYTAAQ